MITPTLQTFLERPQMYINFAKQGEKIIVIDGNVELTLTRKEE